MNRESLTHLLADVAVFRSGGDQLNQWMIRLMKSVLPEDELAWGFLIVPQLGEGSGQLLEFADIARISENTANWVGASTKGFWNGTIPSSTFLSENPTMSESSILITIPIAFWFEHPIGLLWTLVPKLQSFERNEERIERMTSAAHMTAIVMRAEISANAIESLSKSIAVGSETLRAAAKQVAEECRKALGCTATFVWSARRGLLTGLAGSGTGEGLNLDMHVGEGLAGTCAANQSLIQIDDLNDPRELDRLGLPKPQHPEVAIALGWRSAVLVPLEIGEGKAGGVFAAYAERPRAFFSLDQAIVRAFAQRLSAGYLHTERFERLADMERRLSLEAPAIEAGIQAMERVHDADNSLILAQSCLSDVLSHPKVEKGSNLFKWGQGASEHIDLAHKTIKSLVRRAKVRGLVLGNRDLQAVLLEACNRTRASAEQRRISLRLDCPVGIEIRIDAEQMQRVFQNFLSNSIFFLEDDNKSTDRLIEVTGFTKDEYAVASFFDNGRGIQDDNIGKLFDYTFTTKGDRGMGFGLAINKRLVNMHGGKIEVSTKWGYFTRFQVLLPLRDEPRK
jgi:signal transduction histidine kinase